jgi:adenine/guanine phosphoribosyltransferase-like PRPP-binding protein
MSIITDIIDWSDSKPKFLQEAIGRIIQKNILSEDDILELTLICKSEKGLAKYPRDLIDLIKLKESLKESDVSNAVSVVKIFSTENINALQNNSELRIEAGGLTIVYGDNGSGKSSYVSILKQVCNTRGSIPVINKNLFIDSAMQQNQKAKIQYKIGEDTASVTWENGNSDSDILKAVHIYDTKSASSYIEDEDEIAFIPLGLTILEQLANVFNKIEENLRREIGQLELKRFDYSFLINEDVNEIQTFLKNLSAKSDLKTLDTIANFTTSDQTLLNTTEQEIVKLKALDPAKKISENDKIISRFNYLRTRYEQILSELSIQKIGEIKEDAIKYTELKTASKTLSQQTFSDLPLQGIGSQPWKVLWESAKKFYQYSESKIFPDTNEGYVCPLCLQNLSDDAKKRFKNLVIAAPDKGGVMIASAFAKLLDADGMAIVYKERDIKKHHHENVQTLGMIGDVEGADVLLVDDMIDTAGTICNAASIIKEKGAKNVYAAASHGLFSDPALERITSSPLKKVFVTDTLDLNQKILNHPKIEVISVAPLLAEAINCIYSGESISEKLILRNW